MVYFTYPDMEFDTIETERLKLALLGPEHIAHIFAYWVHEDVMKFFGFQTEEDYNKEKYKSDNGYTTYRTRVLKGMMIEKASGITVGGCSLHNWYPEHHRAELGYMINTDEHKRQGFMSEAVERLISYAFDTLKLNRLEALVDPDNTPSIRLMEKNGFKREALLKQRYFAYGEMRDAIMFTQLKEEYGKLNELQ